MTPRRERKFPRRDYERPVGVLIRGKFHFSQGITVGEGGMGLIADKVPLKKGDSVVLTFFVPKWGFVAMTATLVQLEILKSKDTQYGFQFENINFDSKRMIREYVSQRSEAEATSDLIKVV